jgi:NADPH:quinone reductase-like Zn-dependent oxidoreductase
MKVAVVRKPGGLAQLAIEERADPVLGAGQVLVRVRASSLNYHDYLVVLGKIPTDDKRVPMSDGAGEVVAVGAGVQQLKVGDRVMSLFFPTWQAGGPQALDFSTVPGDGADGFACEFYAGPESAFTRMPQGWSFEEAATLPCAALTAWRGMFVETQTKPGDWVLVQGTGGVSIFALQFAKAAGARVIATSSSDAKLERLKALGADHVINYRETPEWGRKAFELTGGRGVDEVVEIGGPGTLNQSIAACRAGGHISLVGVLTGLAGEVSTAALFSKNITLSGITVGSRAQQEQMVCALEANPIRPVISDRFPLAEIAAAFELQGRQQHFGKIVLTL